LTDNERFIKEAEIRNLSNLLDEIDVESVYEVGEVSLRNKFYFLKELVKIKYDGSIKDTGAIAEHLESVFKHKMSDNDLSENLYIMFNYEEDKKNNEGMRNSEIDSLNEFVRSRIQYIALYKAIDNIEGMYFDLKSNQDSPRDIVRKHKDTFYNINTIMKKIDTARMDQRGDSFNLLDTKASTNMIKRTLEEKRSDSNMISSGLKALDVMLGGGFEKGRLYTFLGAPKSFKSGTILNMALAACTLKPYDKNEMNDPNKIPTVVYMTMENSLEETMERIFTYLTGKSMRTLDIDHREFYEILKRETYDKTGVNFFMTYKNKNTEGITTDYLYDLHDRLEEDGMEPVLFVHDYLARISSKHNIEDLRIRLGSVTDEFTAYAKDKNVPLVTAAQLNRDAQHLFDSYKIDKKRDALKNITRQNVSESSQIIENTDVAIAVFRESFQEEDPNLNDYITFKYIVGRNPSTDSNFKSYFAQEFENGFKFKLDAYTDNDYSKEAVDMNMTDKEHRTASSKFAREYQRKQFIENQNSSAKSIFKDIQDHDPASDLDDM